MECSAWRVGGKGVEVRDTTSKGPKGDKRKIKSRRADMGTCRYLYTVYHQSYVAVWFPLLRCGSFFLILNLLDYFHIIQLPLLLTIDRGG